MAPLALLRSASAHWSGGPGPTGPEVTAPMGRYVRPVRPVWCGPGAAKDRKISCFCSKIGRNERNIVNFSGNHVIFSENSVVCIKFGGIIVIKKWSNHVKMKCGSLKSPFFDGSAP